MAESHAYRKKFFVGNFIFLGICILILGMLFALRDLLSRSKMDFTQDKVYTISPATKDILKGLIDKIQVNYYVSGTDKLSMLQNLARDTRDLFDEFQEISGGKFQFAIINPEEKAAKDAEEKVAAYYAAKEKGETPEEPEPVQTIDQIFGGKKAPTKDEVRQEREKQAEAIATRQNRPKEDIKRELLQKEFEHNLLEKLEQEGIEAYPFTEREASSVKQVKVYTSIEVRYLDKQPEIIPGHGSIEALEYELASRIVKLTQDEKPVVAFFDVRKPPAPKFDPMNPTQPPPSDYAGITNYMGQLFDIHTIDLREGDSLDDLVKRVKEDAKRKAREKAGEEEDDKKKDEKGEPVQPEEIPKFVKCFIVAQPDGLEPRQVYEINRAASLGVPTIFLTSKFTMDISQSGLQQGLPINMLMPGSEFEDMLRRWGVELGNEFLAANEAGPLQLPRNVGGGLVLMQPQDLPTNVAPAGPDLDQLSALTNRIPQLIFPASSGLKLLTDVLKKSAIEHDVLARTPKHCWSVKIDPFARLQNPMHKHQGIGSSVVERREDLLSMKDPDTYQNFLDQPMPLAVLLRGKLPFGFEGESVPEWKKEPKPDDKKGFGGLDEDADKDLLLNSVDPEDAPGAKQDAPAKSGGEKPAEAQKPAEATQPAPAPPEAAATPAAKKESGAPAAPPQPAEAAPPAVKPEAGTAAATPPVATPSEPKPAATTEAKPEAKTEPPPPPPKAHVDVKDGRVLVLASVDMFKTPFLQQAREYQLNVSFLQNATETFGLGEKLLEIRRKQLTIRQFKPGSERWYKWITAFNVFIVPVIVGFCGLLYFLLRRTESVAYERKYVVR